MVAEARRWPERTWAIEGCQGIGRHIASRLLAAGGQVVDVPPRQSARTRVFATGQGRKTDATDAHSVALAATRMPGLRQVVDDQQLAATSPPTTNTKAEAMPSASHAATGSSKHAGTASHTVEPQPLR